MHWLLRRAAARGGRCPRTPLCRRPHGSSSSRPTSLTGQSKVVVGVSGGVDSAVTTMLMCEKYGRDQVTGVFMRNWDTQDDGELDGQCPADAELAVARAVCQRLAVPLVEVEFVKEYWNRVFQPFLDGLAAGQTPNPDAACNREIKFQCFAEFARRRLRADVIATGHYAQIDAPVDSTPRLRRAHDRVHDQTYFLATVQAHQWSPSIEFPLGSLTKDRVRELAAAAGLAMVADKKTSTGLCFVGKRKFSQFIGQFVHLEPGPLVDVDSGNWVGQHTGLPTLTVGQRAGISGAAQPWYVCGKRPEHNEALVCAGALHPALFRSELAVHSFSWLSTADGRAPTGGRFRAQIRYRQPSQLCTVTVDPDDCTSLPLVQFDQPLKAATPGQILALYDDQDDSICYGGGPIM